MFANGQATIQYGTQNSKMCTILSDLHLNRFLVYKIKKVLPYILESNLHPFYSFRGLKNQMRIKITCGLDLRS